MNDSSIQITRLILGPLDTNCYLVSDKFSSECLIIDPADDGASIIDEILRQQLEPTAIVLTHAHVDHVLGLLEVKLAFDVPIYMHSDDLFLLKRTVSTTKHWFGRQVPPPPFPDIEINDGDKIAFNKKHSAFNVKHLTFIHTPGHTPGSVSLHNDEILISGDTLFANGVGRTDFSYSSNADLKDSLTKLGRLAPHLEVYPGHGEAERLETALKRVGL